MSLKRFLLAITAIGMLAAAMANSASAAATTGGEWYVNGATLPVGTHESVECEIGEHNGEKKFVLTGSVGTNQTPIKLTATGVDCLESTIWNAGTTQGRDTGKLTFTNVTVSEPSNCSVEGGDVTTNLLTTELYYDAAEPTIAFDKFEPDPEAGVTNFANVKITGASCSITGTKITKGNVFGQAVNPTGTKAVKQGLTFSSAIDETAGSALEFAGNPAHLTGRVDNFLSGTNKGKEWYAEK